MLVHAITERGPVFPVGHDKARVRHRRMSRPETPQGNCVWWSTTLLNSFRSNIFVSDGWENFLMNDTANPGSEGLEGVLDVVAAWRGAGARTRSECGGAHARDESDLPAGVTSGCAAGQGPG